MTDSYAAGWATGDVVFAAEYRKGWGAIFDSTLGGSAATIDITSINGSYAHLLAIVYARGDTAVASTPLNLRFNGDSGANYDFQQLYGSGSSPQSVETFASTSTIAGIILANTSGANLFCANAIFIPHYAGSANNKASMTLGAAKGGTSGSSMATGLYGGFWRSNAAINRITLLPGAGNFVAGTRVTLYAMGA